MKSKFGKSTSKGASSSSSSSSKPSSSTPASKNRVSKSRSKGKPAPPKQQKTKSALASVKKKKKIYTDEQLGVPKLNMITPAGVVKPKGKKKGKVFVDDRVCFARLWTKYTSKGEGTISKLTFDRRA